MVLEGNGGKDRPSIVSIMRGTLLVGVGASLIIIMGDPRSSLFHRNLRFTYGDYAKDTKFIPVLHSELSTNS